MPKLKVFCTTSGFHDSVVAAPSRPAALKAWGANTDLFSMGVAKQVTDPKIVKKALARPGEVVQLSRTSGQEPKSTAKRPARKGRAKPPSRAKLAAVEQRLAKLEQEQAKERDTIDRELRALERKREQLRRRHAKARSATEDKLAEARERYESALEEWPG